MKLTKTLLSIGIIGGTLSTLIPLMASCNPINEKSEPPHFVAELDGSITFEEISNAIEEYENFSPVSFVSPTGTYDYSQVGDDDATLLAHSSENFARSWKELCFNALVQDTKEQFYRFYNQVTITDQSHPPVEYLNKSVTHFEIRDDKIEWNFSAEIDTPKGPLSLSTSFSASKSDTAVECIQISQEEGVQKYEGYIFSKSANANNFYLDAVNSSTGLFNRNPTLIEFAKSFDETHLYTEFDSCNHVLAFTCGSDYGRITLLYTDWQEVTFPVFSAVPEIPQQD